MQPPTLLVLLPIKSKPPSDLAPTSSFTTTTITPITAISFVWRKTTHSTRLHFLIQDHRHHHVTTVTTVTIRNWCVSRNMPRSHYRRSRSPRRSRNGRGRDQRSRSPDRYRSRSRDHRRHRSESRNDRAYHHRYDSRDDRSRGHRYDSRDGRDRRDDRRDRGEECGDRRSYQNDHDQPARDEPLSSLPLVDCENMEIKIGNIDFFFRESSAQGSATTEIPHTMVAHAAGHVYGNAHRQTHALIDGFFDKIGDNAGISLLISVDQKPDASTGASTGAGTGEPSAATSNSASRPPALSVRPRARARHTRRS